ncbi:RIO1 family [Nakaseomyces bracarensis]|uniref:non-specific serine/threonine protein kinase n=1 Tax=Nakaseomyces bracarensis TaxID=273131 RepID=A0ABR4NVG9_9SACH
MNSWLSKITSRNNSNSRSANKKPHERQATTWSTIGSRFKTSTKSVNNTQLTFNGSGKSDTLFKEVRIAKGTTCDVVVTMDQKLGKLVTKKIYTTDRDPSKDYRESMAKVLLNEYEVLIKLKNAKFIVDAYDINIPKKTITMEFLPFSLSRVLYMDLYPTLEERKCYFNQICLAVEYLHSHGVIHRDLKLENIMITDNACHIKLVDFGVAVITNGNSTLTDCKGMCGTEALMAPEVLSSIDYKGQPADCWSLGIIMYQMFNIVRNAGRWKPDYPWSAARKSDQIFKKYIENNESIIVDNIEDDKDIIELIIQFLKIDTTERRTMQNISNTNFINNTKNLTHNHDRTLRVCNNIFDVRKM